MKNRAHANDATLRLVKRAQSNRDEEMARGAKSCATYDYMFNVSVSFARRIVREMQAQQ